MKKHPARKRSERKARVMPIGMQQALPLLEAVASIREGLRDFVIHSGMEVLERMFELERERLCGPARKKQEDRKAYRYGYDQGQLVMGGRKVSLAKPRVRGVNGGEIVLPWWETFRQSDPLDERVIEQILLGVTTRDYERSLEPLDRKRKSIGVKKSSVSRRFVAATARRVEQFLNRPLGELDLPVVMVDGIVIAEHTILVALGIDRTGQKHVLGIWDGVSESEQTCRQLFRSLVDRGLVVDRARLFVIDGSKGLRAAIRSTFGSSALVQRCQAHKLRNVLDHLPETRREWVRARMRKAWEAGSESAARAQLHGLARSLEDQHPGAASSLREGLDETLTIMTLGVQGALYRTLRSTNPIENLQGAIREATHNVKRWRNGRMILRWLGTALEEAQHHFRRIKGVRDLPSFLAALDARLNTDVADEEKTA